MSTPSKRAPRKPRMSEHSRFLATLADLAANPAVSPDKLGQVIDAHDRFTAREAVAAYNTAFVAAQKAIPAVVRDATNDLTMSRYARLETVSMAVDPVILAHGLSISFATGDSALAGHYRVLCIVRHEGGHSETYPWDVPRDADAYEDEREKIAVHAFGSAMTYGQRYAKVMTFNVRLIDEDTDGNPPPAPVEFITEAEVADLVAEVQRVGGSVERLLRALRVNTLAELPRDRLDEARRLNHARVGA
jgi:hypothetical protein